MARLMWPPCFNIPGYVAFELTDLLLLKDQQGLKPTINLTSLEKQSIHIEPRHSYECNLRLNWDADTRECYLHP